MSHGIVAGGADCVRVDVWDGQFVGSAFGWSVLPQGEYDVGAETESLGTIEVRSRELVDGAVSTETGWELRGSPGGAFSAYFWGAMHGTVSAAFDGDAADGAQWGLIARHYSAFHHVRIVCSKQSEAQHVVQLIRLANEPPDTTSHIVIAESRVATMPRELDWSFNGDRHVVSANGNEILTARDGYMGGVEIVGVFSDTPDIRCRRATVTTTQIVPRHTIRRSAYTASIRPGNIDRLSLALPGGGQSENVCWESGIQFGHIGGSEIKFTQAARLSIRDEGDVVASVAWDGPMPKFVDQSIDVRGHARGIAHFYNDQIVIADDVLAWTNRSVGPDIDLLGRLMDSPARVALAGENVFRDWALPCDGSMAWIKPLAPSGAAMFPALVAFPLRLGNQRGWLKALTLLRYPSARQTPGAAFAWQCPRNLTASHDFRCTPVTPGMEYGCTIALRWQISGSVENVERDLLAWRDEWLTPMRIEAVAGATVVYAARDARDAPRDAPREAMNFDAGFDLSAGRYAASLDEKLRLELRLDPLGITRRRPVFAIRGDDIALADDEMICRLNNNALRRGIDFLIQRAGHRDEMYMQLLSDIVEPSTFCIQLNRKAGV